MDKEKEKKKKKIVILCMSISLLCFIHYLLKLYKEYNVYFHCDMLIIKPHQIATFICIPHV